MANSQRYEHPNLETGTLRRYQHPDAELGIVRRYEHPNLELVQPLSLPAPTGEAAVKNAANPDSAMDVSCDPAPAGTLFDRYVLQRGDGGAPEQWTDETTVPKGSDPAVTVEGLADDTEFRWRWLYRVDTVKTAGLDGTPSGVAVASTDPDTLPAPSLSASLADVDAVETVVGTVAGASGYELRRSTDGGSTWIGGGDGWITWSSGTSTDDASGGGLPTGSGQALLVQVRAMDGATPGGVAETTVTMPTFQAPTLLTATAAPSASQIDVDFTEGAASEGIAPTTTEVEVSSVGPSSGFAHLADVAEPPHTHNVGVEGAQRWYRARSQYTSAETSNEYFSGYSNVDEDTTAVTPPAAPTINDQGGFDDSGTIIANVEWAAVSGATSYTVELDQRANSMATWDGWVEVGSTTATCMSADAYNEGALDDTKEYRMRVLASNAGGDSAWAESAVIDSFAEASPPCAPGGGT